MIKLHGYQKSVVGEVYQGIKDGETDIVLVAPTGSGKTYMSAKIISDALSKGRQVIFLVTINCLIDQTISSFEKIGITDYGVICDKFKESPDALLQIASLQSLARRRAWLDRQFGLAVFDEAHTSRWFGVADEIQAKWTIGLTATPFRLSKKQGFGDKFSHAVLAPNMIELTRAGNLAPLRYKGLQSVDTSQIKLIGGDFNDGELSKVCNTPEAITSSLDGWELHASNLRTIAFSVDIKHGKNIVQGLRDRGYTAEIVTGSTKNRQPIFDAFQGDGIQGLVSCNALSTGFDVPNVECGLMMRPTKSLALHMQQIGRVARIAPGKTHGLILDAAGNCDLLGFPESISESLTAENVLSCGVDSLGQAPIKKCPECEELILAAARICPNCGYEFEFEASDREVAVGQFVDLLNPAFVRLGDENDHATYYRSLIRKHWYAGRCPSTAYADYLKQGFERYPKPGFRWARGAIFDDDLDQVLPYWNSVQRWRFFLKKNDKWADWLFRQEFGSAGIKRLEEIKNAKNKTA